MKLFSRREAMKLAGASALAASAGLALAQDADQISGGASTKPTGAISLATGLEQGMQDGKYVLPPLPYEFNALEPLYEERMLRIHHGTHHAGYVNNLNKTLDQLAAARSGDQYDAIQNLSRQLAFNGSGHMLHTLFWNSMAPGGAQMPKELAGPIQQSFGSVEACQKQFAAAAKAVMSNGWALLVYEPLSDRLLVLQAERHQDLTIWNTVPLLVCDVWEHAYYLQYTSNRMQWVDQFMKLANWPFAMKRYQAARMA